MKYNVRRFGEFWDAAVPGEFSDFFKVVYSLVGRDTAVENYERILLQELPPVTLAKEITLETIQKGIIEAYTLLVKAGLEYKSGFDTDDYGTYPEGFAFFLQSGAEFADDKPQNYKIAVGLLYIMDAFIRGLGVKNFTEAVLAFPFEKYLGDISQLNDIEDFTSGYQSNKKFFKGVSPVNLPDYVLEEGNYVNHEGYWYSLDEIEKAMDASGSAAQSLEKQDLEGGMTNSGEEYLNDEERGKAYIKKLKLRGRKK